MVAYTSNPGPLGAKERLQVLDYKIKPWFNIYIENKVRALGNSSVQWRPP